MADRPDLPEENTPAIVAYRVGQLERAVQKGFEQTSDKIDEILKEFVTVSTFTQAQQDADKVHTNLQKQIDKINTNLGWVVKIVVGSVLMAILYAVVGLPH